MKRGCFMDAMCKMTAPSIKMAVFVDTKGQMATLSMKMGVFMDKRAEIDGAGQKIWPFLGHEWLNDCSVHKNGRFHGQSGGIEDRKSVV